MREERVALFVRLPPDQVAALDRLVQSTGMRKQQLVSELLGDKLAVGRIDIGERAGAEHDVLTLQEVAALLGVPTESVSQRAEAGELPGRRLGEEWRFSRGAVMDWLASGEGARSR